jgi:hypothetical protein
MLLTRPLIMVNPMAKPVSSCAAASASLPTTLFVDRERSAEVMAGRDSSSWKREKLAVVEGCSHYIRTEPWVVCQFDPRNRDNAH